MNSAREFLERAATDCRRSASRDTSESAQADAVLAIAHALCGLLAIVVDREAEEEIEVEAVEDVTAWCSAECQNCYGFEGTWEIGAPTESWIIGPGQQAWCPKCGVRVGVTEEGQIWRLSGPAASRASAGG